MSHAVKDITQYNTNTHPNRACFNRLADFGPSSKQIPRSVITIVRLSGIGGLSIAGSIYAVADKKKFTFKFAFR